MAKRTVNINITLDEGDNEVLEIMAGTLGRSPDTVLSEMFADAIKVSIAKALKDARRISEDLDAVQRGVLRARALVTDKKRARGEDK